MSESGRKPAVRTIAVTPPRPRVTRMRLQRRHASLSPDRWRRLGRHRRHLSGRCLGLGLGLLGLWLMGSCSIVVGQGSLEQRRQTLEQAFQEQMRRVADDCGARNLDRLQAATLDWIATRDSSRRYLFLPPAEYADPGRDAAVAGQRPAWPQWSERVKEQRVTYATQLYELAQAAAKEEAWDLCGQLLWEAAWQNPAQPDLRRILGLTNNRAESARLTVRVARRAEPTLGWPAGQYREAMSAHFRVLSNADEATLRPMVETFEVWRLLWRQAAFAYWAPGDGALAAILGGRTLPEGNENRHTVVVFANRAQFLQALARVPGIQQSVGYYDTAAQRCYFYLEAEDPNASATQRHELVHQLFQETGRRVRQPGEKSHFWLLEAVAMYFESLQRLTDDSDDSPPSVSLPQTAGGQVWSVGGFDAQRLQYARLRALREGYAYPLGRLSAHGRGDFQAVPDLPRVYSQSAGLFQFLLHASPPGTKSSATGEESQTTNELTSPAAAALREATWRMLIKIYAGRDRADLMESESGWTTERLQVAYQAWLPVAVDELQPDLRLASERSELALGFSPLSDAHLERLTAPELRWLQLTKTRVTDVGLRQLARHHHRLEELYLDQTPVSDDGVIPLVRANPNLESLDLAGTEITDATVLACRDLQQLEALWLTGTAVTDACVPQLLALPKLQQLDVQGTSISPAKQQELRARFK